MALIAVAQSRRTADYLESIRRAGGEPVEISVAASDDAFALLQRADGLVLTGGGDVDPALYGEDRHPTFEAAEPGRDEFEIAVVRAAMEADLPCLAICRGMQVLNVALGGKLVQDIPDQIAGALNHSVREPRFAIAHEVWVASETRTFDLLREHIEDGEVCQVNSRHHQAVRSPAEGFEVTATAPDGVIEAMERPASTFCVAVQWHPENFWRTGEFRSLFEGLVRAAATARKR
jgi:putative glutamine amidotransferase